MFRSLAAHRARVVLVVLVVLAAAACGTAPTPEPASRPAAITTAEQLVSAMRERYAGRWYDTLTFVQRNERTLPGGGIEHTTWYEAMVLPGRLRIDFDSTGRDGLLFVNDTQYVIVGDSLRRTIAAPHPLLLLGFDVYALPVERTLATLGRLGFDLSRVRADTWQGRPAIVVGADSGDLHSRQFWVDRERLVFVRMLQPSPQDTTKTNEVRFNAYRPLGEGWISPEVEFLTDGQRTFFERYEDIRIDVPLPEGTFDPHRWSTTPRWFQRP